MRNKKIKINEDLYFVQLIYIRTLKYNPFIILELKDKFKKGILLHNNIWYDDTVDFIKDTMSLINGLTEYPSVKEMNKIFDVWYKKNGHFRKEIINKNILQKNTNIKTKNKSKKIKSDTYKIRQYINKFQSFELIILKKFIDKILEFRQIEISDKISDEIFSSRNILSKRCHNFIKYLEIQNWTQLSSYSENDLLKFRNIGKRTLAEIKTELAIRNLKLKES